MLRIRRFDGATTVPAACETVTTFPATTRLALRAPAVFGAMVKGTVTEPVRCAEGKVIHLGVPVFVHRQPAPAVTEMVPLMPAAGAEMESGVTV